MASNNPKHDLSKSIRPKNSARNPAKDAPGKPQAATGVTPPPKKGDNSGNDTQERKFWRKKPVETVTLIIVLAYTVISFFQWLALKDSNQINRETLVSVQRAFVTFKGFRTGLSDERCNSEVKTFFRVQAIWENSGTTPAIATVSSFNFKELPDEPDETEFKGAHQLSDFSIGTIGPKAELMSLPLSIPQSLILCDQPGSSRRFCSWGWIVYRDVFPKTKLHVTEFCQKLNETRIPMAPATGIATEWATCRHHNCADENCEDYQAIANIMPK